MIIEEIIRKALLDAVYDWESDFEVDVEYTDRHNGYSYYSAVMDYRDGRSYDFGLRLKSGSDIVEMNANEDDWEPVTKGSVFAFLWFNEITHST